MTAAGPARQSEEAEGDRPAGTIAQLLADRADDEYPGILDQTGTWMWREVVAAAAQRARAARSLVGDEHLHAGVLLPNVPEFLFWLGAMALSGGVMVGINPTRRGQALAADVRSTDCQMIITDGEGAERLKGLDLGVNEDNVLVVTSERYQRLLSEQPEEVSVGDVKTMAEAVAPDALFLLLFTSGTTGAPKAVRCTQGRLAAIAESAAGGHGYQRHDVSYCPMPLFHGNALMALWAPTLKAGATMAIRPRFSASNFLNDVRTYRATTFTYVGKAIAYILATPEGPDDADNALTRGFGTEASVRDRREFRRRFGCPLVEGYGQSEGGTAINPVPGTPKGSLGKPTGDADIAIMNPETGAECPPAQFGADRRLLNAGLAIGEIVNRGGIGSFEGYYNNDEAEAERTRKGWYWSGDLGYRDEEGFFYFAGRTGDWLRVDSENFAAGPVEQILARHPSVAVVAVYPVPDTRSGDQVMAALELRPEATFDPDEFAGWLFDQPDLGTKWAPLFVRVCDSLPQTASGKVTKTSLRNEAWQTSDPVFWRPEPGSRDYRRLDEDDRRGLDDKIVEHRGADAVPQP